MARVAPHNPDEVPLVGPTGAPLSREELVTSPVTVRFAVSRTARQPPPIGAKRAAISVQFQGLMNPRTKVQ